MKFLCKCGKTIHDTTDDLFYKGTIIADQDMASMSRSILIGVLFHLFRI